MAATLVTTVAPAEEEAARQGEEALERLRSADAPLYLSPSPELAKDARTASRYLFSSLVPFCPKPPLDSLLVDDGFDAEQIWCQIDLLSRPLLSVLRRDLNRLERDPPARVPGIALDVGVVGEAAGAEKERVMEDGEGDEEDGDESEGDEEEEEAEEDEDEGDEEEKEDEEGEAKGNQVEDKFLKIKELVEYLEKEEEKAYGLPERKGNKRKEKISDEEEDEDDDEEEDADDDEEEDDLDVYILLLIQLGDFDGDGDEETGIAENARYEDFFGGIKKKGLNKNGIVGKRKRSSNAIDFVDGLESTDMDIEENDDEGQKILSTHEKELKKLHSKIEQMEKANLEPQSWTMQGEVTAAKRPKNSALEVDLDFEHNVRPAPVITEEVTASLEDIIRKRIIEGHFDDVQRAPTLLSKAPKEHKQLDENKSKKSLAEIYEEEYAQKSGLASAPLTVSDTLKNEDDLIARTAIFVVIEALYANLLFKKLCSKLDALSHFHFAPKPVIEDMSIQVNVPALAMEEIAPVAVSDAAMLAPEEIFQGKGDIKEEAELTKAERKRRRANKKRKFKAEMAKRTAKKAGQNVIPGSTNEKPVS
ncbi:Mpp10 protein [Musa troglodytarum]|uniref:U3 small nucleolar ribonucleoprotein protein MPP10 n=1 Tax=Musa troglodytarum TaxID=320322 RepID=A0A9E7EDZ8_9LILI|nr:Mpp10 protein [Musa troglodytarum]